MVLMGSILPKLQENTNRISILIICLIFMNITHAQIPESASSFLSYNGGVISFGNESFIVDTCINNSCYPGLFVTIIDGVSVNSTARPILDSMVRVQVGYSLPFDKTCIIKLTSKSALSLIRNDTENSSLFFNGKDNFVISADVGSDPYIVAIENNTVCIITNQNKGELIFFIESTGNSSPQDYYKARLYGFVVIENVSIIQIDKNQLRATILDIFPFEFYTSIVTPNIKFRNDTGCNIIFFYKSTINESRNISGCDFNQPISIDHFDGLYAPFDYYLAKIVLDRIVSNPSNFSTPTTIPDSFVASTLPEGNKIIIRIDRSDNKKWPYLIFIVLNLILLALIFQVKFLKMSIQKIAMTIITTIIFVIFAYSPDFVFALPSVIVYLLSLIIIIIKWKSKCSRELNKKLLRKAK